MGLDKPQLAQLVAAAQQQDPDAFAQLYEDCYKSLFRTAYYMLGNRQDAEDVVMDTVADAYATIGKLRVSEAFPGWIHKILCNKARRKRGITAYRGTVELPETLEDESAGIQLEHVDLMRALDSLTVEERAIVVLAVCEGYTSAEIGRMLSLRANTVRSKQMRALQKLRARLE